MAYLVHLTLIPSRSCRLRSSGLLPGRRVTRLAEVVGATGLTYCRPRWAVLGASLLAVACRLVKRHRSVITLEVSLCKTAIFNL
jgi:hypothetical protein